MRSGSRPSHLVGLALIALTLVSCGDRNVVIRPQLTAAPPPSSSALPSATPSHTPAPVSDPASLGTTRRTLGQRQVPYGQFPSPVLFIVEIPDLATGRYQRAAPPGFQYVTDGTLTMVTSNSTVDVRAGEARAFPSEPWELQNLGPGPLTYWDLFAYDDSARNQSPGGPPALVTPPLDAPNGVPYELRLDLVSIDVGGRTEALLHGGPDAILVLSGAIEVREPGQHLFVGSHTAVFVPAQTGVQLFALDSQPATVLEFFYTLDGRTFVTRLSSSP